MSETDERTTPEPPDAAEPEPTNARAERAIPPEIAADSVGTYLKAALGVAQTRNVLDLVRRLADQGLAVLMVSHNMNDVFEVADRVAVMFLGRMAFVRPASELDVPTVVDIMTTGTSTRLNAKGDSGDN